MILLVFRSYITNRRPGLHRLKRRVERAAAMPRHLNTTLVSPHPTLRSRPHFFNLDLHIGVISDLKDLLCELGVAVTDWTLSDQSNIIGRIRTPVIGVNELSFPRLLDSDIYLFHKVYDRYLSKFDGFICTHTPAMVRLFLKYDKPVICVISTRYEHPYTDRADDWEQLNSELQRAHSSGQLILIANNRGDADYLTYYTGLEPRFIPSICKYTGAPRTNASDDLVLASRSSRETNLLATNAKGFLRPRATVFAHGTKWSDLHAVRGWVHVPYNISQMSIFEQYYAGVPIYVPDDNSLIRLWSEFGDGALSQVSYYSIKGLATAGLAVGDPNRVHAEETMRWWLARADFAAGGDLSLIRRFSGVEQLRYIVGSEDPEEISQEMHDHNRRRLTRVLEQWTDVVEQVLR
jgi:hypothetical protein